MIALKCQKFVAALLIVSEAVKGYQCNVLCVYVDFVLKIIIKTI